MAKNPQLNRAHQKAWYSRTRQDPVQWRAFLEKRRAYKQARREGVAQRRSACSPRHDLEPTPAIDVGDIQRHVQELFEERAAIMEMDGGLTRKEAERLSGGFSTDS